MAECSCFACTKAHVAVDPGELMFGQPVAMMRMFLCTTCGNKRCPHAADHRLTCTGSNEPGQPGSLYADALTFESTRKGKGGSPPQNSTEAREQ